ncbi:MAG: hypothetical protein BGP14_07360 [Sphingobacteriales bacterium 44-15]|nr:MAG: hypothetical protein BGP14_07360 [Sphingobacteriales bacterium 44-15]
MSGKGLILEAASFYTHDKPVLIYGPVYFYIQAFIMKILGFSEWVFRLVNFFSAIGILFFMNHVMRKRVSKKIRISILILLSFDTIFLQNAHSGRMDLLALLFIMISYIPLINIRHSFRDSVFSAVFALLALLTTPRSAIFLLPIAFWLINKIFKEKRILPSLSFIAIVLCGYFIWIVLGFGGVKEFFSYYTSTSVREGSNNLFDSFVGGNLNIRPFQIPLIFFTLITFFLSKKREWTWLTVICITNIVVFYLTVKDTGLYSALIIPFWLLLLAENINSMSSSLSRLKFLPILIPAFVSISIFTIKAVIIWGSLEERKPGNIYEWVKSNIPAGSRVVGDYKYYYAVIKSESDFQFIELGETVKDRLQYHLNAYHADYILTSAETQKETLETYLAGIGSYNEIDIKLHQSTGKIPQLIKRVALKLPVTFSNTYEGKMYKIVR